MWGPEGTDCETNHVNPEVEALAEVLAEVEGGMGAVRSHMCSLQEHAMEGRRSLAPVERRARGGAARFALESGDSWTRRGRHELELEGMGMGDSST